MGVVVFPIPALGADSGRVPGHGDATPLSIGFEWDRGPGAESCPDGDAVRRATEKVLERRPFVGADQANVLIRGTVDPTVDGRTYEARLFLVAGDGTVVGERKLRSEGPNCSALSEPLALVIGLAIDTLRQMPATSLRIRPPKPSPQTWKGEVAPLAAATWGLLPAPGIGFGLEARAGPSSWSIEGAATWFLPNDKPTAGGPGGDFRAVLWSVSICPSIAGSVAELRICLGGIGARLSATGMALDLSLSPTSWMFGAGARAMVLLHLGRAVALEPSLGAIAPFVRDRFTYADEMQQVHVLHQAWPMLLTLQLGVSVQIF